MPIRFRCAYCNQLMGISHRKAGTVVRCPNCAGQVIVPNSDGSDPGTGKAVEPREGGAEALFERGDFEDALRAASGGKRATASPAGAAPAPIIPAVPAEHKGKDGGRYEVEPLDFPSSVATPAEPPGIYLSPAMATLLSVALVVALAFAFTAGLIVGRFFFTPAHEERGEPAAPAVATPGNNH